MSYYDDYVSKVKFAREAGHVRRLHVHRVVGSYDIAQHVYGALCLLRVLHPEPPLRLVWAVLSHDKPERLTGDIPSPAKQADWFDNVLYGDHEQEILKWVGFSWPVLSQEERAWLEAVDAIEFYLFVLDQEAIGNKTLGKPKEKIVGYIQKSLGHWPNQVYDFWNELHKHRWPGDDLSESTWKMCPELETKNG